MLNLDDLELPLDPYPGIEIRHKSGQIWECLDSEPYERADGVMSKVFTWGTTCPATGEYFQFKTGMITQKGQMKRYSSIDALRLVNPKLADGLERSFATRRANGIARAHEDRLNRLAVAGL